MEWVNIGTLVRLTAEPADGKVLLKLSYECSRFEGEGTDESPPDTTTFQIDTTLLLEAGKPTLVGGSSASATSYLMVSVDQLR
jgi:type II secretory pathway component GspD/PulD (secretin)